MRNRWVLLLALAVVGSGPAWAQSIASTSMTVVDHDGNGFASIGDEIEISVVVDGAVTGTLVRLFDNALFESAGPFNLYKVTPGFGDGIEYARTLTVGPGDTHDGVVASSVEFLVQARVSGVTQDDTFVTLEDAEWIDNVPPATTDARFTASASTLIPGTEFEVGIDASDGSGPVEVTADLSRLGLEGSVPIPHQADDTWLLEGEQVQEAMTSEQVSLAQDRSIVFTVTDAAGNVTVHDSASDDQIRLVDNVSPPPPNLKAFQRATNFDSAQDLFDLVLTDGPDPVDQFGEPLLNDSGQPITYSDLMASGETEFHFAASGEPFSSLTVVGYNSNGTLVQVNLPFTEFAENKLLEFQAQPIKSSGLSGEAGVDSLIIQRGVVEATILEPEGTVVVGNGPEVELSGVVAQPVEALSGYAAENGFRAYVRDVANPSVIEFIDMTAEQDGTYVQSFVVQASDFVAAGFGPDVDLVIRPVFTVDGVALRTLNPSIVFQNNPTIRLEIDPDLRGGAVFHDRFQAQQP